MGVVGRTQTKNQTHANSHVLCKVKQNRKLHKSRVICKVLREKKNRHRTSAIVRVYFACGVKKKHRFFTVFQALRSKEFHLGDVTKPHFLRGFGLQEGARGGKIGTLRSFQHRWPKMAQHGPTWAQHRPTWAQHRPNMGR